MLNKDEVLISIDAGKDSTKYCYKNAFGMQKGKFRTKVQKVENLGVDLSNGTYLVEYNGSQYLIGDMVDENKVNFDLSKESIEHKLAVYLSVFKVLTDVQCTKVKLSVGIPINLYKNSKFREEMKSYIMNNNFVNITVNGKNMKFSITDVLVLPEACGDVYSHMYEYKKIRATIIDIGGLNVNICQYTNATPNLNSMLTCNLGANILRNKIAKELGEKYGIIISPEDIKQILQDGVLYLDGEEQAESREVISDMMKAHLDEIISFTKQNGISLNNNGKLVFAGGGSLLLKNFIKEKFKNSEICEDSQFANVLSAYKILSVKNGQA